jgi:hypothetical protein
MLASALMLLLALDTFSRLVSMDGRAIITLMLLLAKMAIMEANQRLTKPTLVAASIHPAAFLMALNMSIGPLAPARVPQR